MSFPRLTINSTRMKQDFDELATIGATSSGGITRPALSLEDIQARTWLADKIEDASLTLRDDEVGNLSGVLYCRYPNAKTLLIGSHLDTGMNAGKFDGSIGICAGLECLRTLREAQVALPFHLEIINFTDEEGLWQSLFGSMGLTGQLTESHVFDSVQDNAPFRVALYQAGLVPQDYYKAKRDPRGLLGYLELHIEQSDRLERNQKDIGIVTRVVGRSAYRITFYGEAVHAATNYNRKRDALQGAACFITHIHELAQEFEGGMVNCGNIDLSPGSVTTVPARVSVSLELRHDDEATLLKMQSRMQEVANECAMCYSLRLEAQQLLQRKVAYMAESMNALIETACEEQDLSYMRLVSLAGHDAQMLAPFTPSGLIFVPSYQGISMNPKEYSEWHQVEAGANVLLGTILGLAEQLTTQF